MFDGQALNQNAAKGVVAEYTGGLHGTPNGSTADAVLRFLADPTVAGEGISVATTAADGTIITIDKPGLYVVELGGGIDASAADSLLGISANGNAASLTDAPDFSNTGVLDVLPFQTAASTKTPFKLSTPLEVFKGTQQLVRFLCTTAAGATGGGALIQTSVYYRVRYYGVRQGRTV